MLGALAGLVTGVVVIGFRLAIETVQAKFLGIGYQEQYVNLPVAWRFALPMIGAALCYIVLRWLIPAGDQVGVVHVLARLAYHEGRLPLGPAVGQFLGGALAIISGHSVGREGPSIHLGAASASLLGQRLDLPHNSVRTLVACGAAAAIAASFNTPLAGVIFAMEVVMMEYTIFGFAPVILAAVSATVLTRFVYGGDSVFYVPDLALGSLLELPYLVVFGITMGMLAGIFVLAIGVTTRLTHHWWPSARLLIAALAGGLVATALPQVMGIGYDTLNQALIGELGLTLAASLVGAKMLATVLAISLGLPGGLIGPTLVIGAAAGTVIGTVGATLAPGHAAEAGFYALLGMATLMGATLQAPLAALISILELTGNPNFLLPGMLTVVTAMVVNRRLFRRRPVYLEMMGLLGMDYRNDPLSQHLRRIGVASAMETSVVVVNARLDAAQARAIMRQRPLWLLVRHESGNATLIPGADLARHLTAIEGAHEDAEQPIDILGMPGNRRQARPIDLTASLQEAYEALTGSQAEGLFVTHQANPGVRRVYGVLTMENIERAYQ